MDERQQKIAQLLYALGADAAMLTSPDAVAYATGHVVPIEAGPSPFAGGSTTALVTRDGHCGVVAANVEGAPASASRAEVIELYEGFTFEHGPDLAANYASSLRSAAERLGVSGVIAIEPETCPAHTLEVLAPTRTMPVTAPLARARAVKTLAEIESMERAAGIAAVGQRTFMCAARPGRTELDVFADIRCAMENAAGERLPITGDFMSGPARTAGFTAWPIDRKLEPGDPVMSDLAPRVNGYWGDSCVSSMLGEASAAYLKLFDAAYSALSLAVEIMRPGLAINELDRRVREVVEKAGYAYPHHTGHSLGTSVHEWPRIVPYETAVVEPGMVLMVEPGAYDPEIGGVRTEWMIAVTNDGCRVLTDFAHEPAIAG